MKIVINNDIFSLLALLIYDYETLGKWIPNAF